jgi:hypothetical protein
VAGLSAGIADCSVSIPNVEPLFFMAKIIEHTIFSSSFVQQL